MRIDVEVLRGLLHDDKYATRALPHIQKEFFQSHAEKKIFEFVKQFILDYKCTPSVEALAVTLDNAALNERLHAECVDVLADISQPPEKIQTDWLFDETERWAQNRALHNALTQAIDIYEKNGKDSNLQVTAIPELFKDALSLRFKSDVGLGYFKDMQKQYEYYQHSEDDGTKLKFDIDILNQITRNGVPRKTLNLVLAGVNVGKTAWLSYLAGMYLQSGYNVLFISCEMGEEQIRERIDANILGITTDKFYKIKSDLYIKRLEKIKSQTPGELYIKAYPPMRSNSIVYQNLINELGLKEHFKPDVVLIDYIGIVASSALPVSAMQNSNLYMGHVSKELRALAVENDVVVWSAHQLNREGMKEIEIEMTHSGGSIDITKDADFILSISQPEEFEKRNQALFKQLKNRYNKKSRIRRFIVGMDTDLMRFYQVEDSVQQELMDHRQHQSKKPGEESAPELPATKVSSKKKKPIAADVSDWQM